MSVSNGISHHEDQESLDFDPLNRRWPQIDQKTILVARGLPNATQVVETQHEAILDAELGGLLTRRRANVRTLEAEILPLEARCAEARATEAQVPEHIIEPGGDQPRTATTYLQILLAVLFVLLLQVCDYGALRSLLSAAAPEVSSDPWQMLGYMGALLSATVGFKMFPWIRFRETKDREIFEGRFALLLLISVPVTLACVGHRVATASADPLTDIAVSDPEQKQLISILTCIGQIAGQAIIGASALMYAEKIAYRTRASKIRINSGRSLVTAAADKADEALRQKREELTEARSLLSKTESQLKVFLGEARAALAAAILEDRVAQSRAAAIAQVMPPSSAREETGPVNGRHPTFRS